MIMTECRAQVAKLHGSVDCILTWTFKCKRTPILDDKLQEKEIREIVDFEANFVKCHTLMRRLKTLLTR